MTALALDVRELGFEEIDCVSGGSRLIAAGRWIANAIASGMAYDVAKRAWEEMQDTSAESSEQNPFLADRASSR
jgi:hypothetical protein